MPLFFVSRRKVNQLRRQAMPGRVPVFRIFVSSTFDDLEAERNALQQHVFPRLRELCYASGARFHAIDLRCGLSEEAGLDHQTLGLAKGARIRGCILRYCH